MTERVVSPVVAIVDDNESMRVLTARILKREGWESEAFPDGDRFLAGLAADRFAAVLLDLRMPGTDGLSVLRAMAGRQSAPPVIVLTGHGGIPQAVSAMKLGAVNFLEKPYAARDLVEAVGKAMEARARAPVDAEAA